MDGTPKQANRIVLGVPDAIYHKRELGVVSKTALDEMARSPMHYRAWVDGTTDEDTPALKFGRAFHDALLRPAVYASTYAVPPDFGDLRSSKNREKRDEWREAHPSVTELSIDDDATITSMLLSVRAHPAASRLIAEGEPEVTLYYNDPITGLPCKSRADYWVKARRFAVDAKTTLDASPEQFAKDVARYRYHVQDALYRLAFAECGEQIEHFAILAVEKKPPHAVAVYVLDADAVARGFTAARQGIDRLHHCMQTKSFPGYGDGVTELSLPRWAA